MMGFLAVYFWMGLILLITIAWNLTEYWLLEYLLAFHQSVFLLIFVVLTQLVFMGVLAVRHKKDQDALQLDVVQHATQAFTTYTLFQMGFVGLAWMSVVLLTVEMLNFIVTLLVSFGVVEVEDEDS